MTVILSISALIIITVYYYYFFIIISLIMISIIEKDIHSYDVHGSANAEGAHGRCRQRWRLGCTRTRIFGIFSHPRTRTGGLGFRV